MMSGIMMSIRPDSNNLRRKGCFPGLEGAGNSLFLMKEERNAAIGRDMRKLCTPGLKLCTKAEISSRMHGFSARLHSFNVLSHDFSPLLHNSSV